MFPSFTGLWKPVKGTKVSTVLSTPGQEAIGVSYLDIGMGGHFEGFRGCEPMRLLRCGRGEFGVI